ncbi:MAG TPA: hypothetical protein VII99_15965, partial [Bacteroidia bacterium]
MKFFSRDVLIIKVHFASEFLIFDLIIISKQSGQKHSPRLSVMGIMLGSWLHQQFSGWQHVNSALHFG